MARHSSVLLGVLPFEAMRQAVHPALRRALISEKQIACYSSLHQREWADLRGKFSVLASVDSWTAADVNLKKPSGDIATVPRAKLGKTDQAFLEAWISIEETKQAESKVDELIEQMPSSPDASVNSLIEMHRNGSNLVAGLISSVALATSANINNLKDAERYLNATIVRLRNVQEHLPSFHKQTLVSALNDK